MRLMDVWLAAGGTLESWSALRPVEMLLPALAILTGLVIVLAR